MSYNHEYDLSIIRCSEQEYHAINFLIPFIKGNMTLVDIGCGTCRKIISLSKKVNKIFGLDNNPDMLNQAKKNISDAGVKNVEVMDGNNFHMPFKSNSCDFVTALLTAYCPTEIHRVLKPKGRFLIEILGVNDKLELKQAFGKDKYGWRGILLNENQNEREFNITRMLSSLFEDIEIKNVEWKTQLSLLGLERLLELTPTIRDYNILTDGAIINSLVMRMNLQEKFEFTERRMIITGIKSN